MLQPLPLYFPLQFSASSEFLALGGRDCWENLGNNCIRLAAVPFHTLPTLPPKSFRRVGARGRGTFFKRFPSPAEAASSESLALGGEGPFAKGPLPRKRPPPRNPHGFLRGLFAESRLSATLIPKSGSLSRPPHPTVLPQAAKPLIGQNAPYTPPRFVNYKKIGEQPHSSCSRSPSTLSSSSP